MKRRPPIPSELRRAVLTDAGHRCAIHTCRHSSVEIAHIVAWSRCKEHRFDNLIALCPTCHTRFDKGEIDRKSMLVYKRNLAIPGRRYCDFEWRLIERLSRQPETGEFWLLSDLEILVTRLLEDGLLAATGAEEGLYGLERLTRKQFRFTPKGQDLIKQWMTPEHPNSAADDLGTS